MMTLDMANPHQTDAFGGRLTKSVTFTLPMTLVADLDVIAKRMKVTRSALLGELLRVPVAAMAEVVGCIPETGATSADVRRARGKSAVLMATAVKEAQQLLKPTRPRRRARARAKPK